MNKQGRVCPRCTQILKLNFQHSNKITQEIDYFIEGGDMEANKAASAETTQTIHNEYSDIYAGIVCFRGTFSLHVKDDVRHCQMLPRCIAYALQVPL